MAVHRIKSIDAHVGGQPLRLIVEGLPRPSGTTLAHKREWLRRHADALRRAVVLEPRGHADMTAAMLTEPASPGAHAGLLFMDADGYSAMSGHGVIAAATIVLERDVFQRRLKAAPRSPADLLSASDASAPAHDRPDDVRLVFDTAAGTVQARARLDARGGVKRVDSVTLTNVPSFVHTAAHVAQLGARSLRVDIAFGGAFYAIVDTEAIGIPLTGARLPDLRRLAADLRQSINAEYRVQHPAETTLSGVSGVIFTGPPQDPEAHLRNVTVSGAGVDRSPSGTGTSAVMAVLDAMGLLPEDHTFVHESVTGALFRGRVVRRTIVGDTPALVPEIEGTAWITGEHSLSIDDDDPFAHGFIL